MWKRFISTYRYSTCSRLARFSWVPNSASRAVNKWGCGCWCGCCCCCRSRAAFIVTFYLSVNAKTNWTTIRPFSEFFPLAVPLTIAKTREWCCLIRFLGLSNYQDIWKVLPIIDSGSGGDLVLGISSSGCWKIIVVASTAATGRADSREWHNKNYISMRYNQNDWEWLIAIHSLISNKICRVNI